MKGLLPLVLGIFGTFAFSWAGLTFIPNLQFGHLEPQMDEEGNDAYPAPRSGMAERGRQIYAANGCVYCHTQQVRADYAGSDIERKWGERRSAPRDYIFDHPALLGRMRTGPDLANIGKRAPAEDESAAAPNASTTTPAPAGGASPAAPNAAAPAPASGAPAPKAPGATPAAPNGAAPPPAPAGGASLTPTGAHSPGANAASPTPAAANVAAATPAPAATAPGTPAPIAAQPNAAPKPGASPAAGGPPNPAAPSAPATTQVANAPSTAPTTMDTGLTKGALAEYSAGWHHQHLYSPRSMVPDSNMPSYRFLYETRPVGSQPSADALKLAAAEAAPTGSEIVPTYDAKCLVAYLMSLDQSHALNEVKSAAPASPPAPGKGAK